MKLEELQQPSPFGSLIGTKVVAFDDDRREIEVHYLAHDGFANRIGTLAGAMIAGLLDSVTGLAGNWGLADDVFAVHKSLTVDYERPGPLGRVIGKARVVEVDDRDVEVRGELRDEAGTRFASAAATLRIVRQSPAGGGSD
ncbi:MAG: PaaI family thioesterase [Myxococcota bacterium]